jgi:uncharacterized protein YbbC (DUF1343 family)
MRTGHWALGFWVVVLPWIGCGPQVTPVHSAAQSAGVLPGIDVLLRDSLQLVRGRRVALVTNQSGIDHAGVSDVARLLGAGIKLVALFSPEHGFRGTAEPGETVSSTTDSATGLPIYSLYGKTSAPTDTMLAGVEVVLVDLQDAGARYYTYLWTTVGVMRAAARKGIPVVVLDRPNPIGGAVQGNVLDTALRSPVGLLAIPMRHGMTLGELALLAKSDLALSTDLRVVPVSGWRRSMYFDETGLPFVPPSPNLRSLEALIHYPGTCLFEGTNLSVGRGTEHAFEQVGAPHLDTAEVLRALGEFHLLGVRFEAVTFTPVHPGDGKYADTLVQGIRLTVTDREAYDPTQTAMAMLRVALNQNIRDCIHCSMAERERDTRSQFQFALIPAQINRLAADPSFGLRVYMGPFDPRWPPALERFRARRKPFLLYPE